MVFLALITRAERVFTTIPSTTGKEQAGIRSSYPSISTTHSRHAPVGAKPAKLHRVGTLIPFSLQISSRKSPFLALSSLPFTVIWIFILPGFYCIKLAYFLTNSAARAFFFNDVPGLFVQGDFEITSRAFHAVNFGVCQDFYVGVPADLDQFR